MTISVGDRVPEATLLQAGPDGPETVELSARLQGRKVVLFGLPGAFTRTCTAAHLPSFMRTAKDLKAKGVDEIICVAVNDPFVMQAWDQSTGAGEAGVTLLADAEGKLTEALGLAFSAPAIGLLNRAQRFAMLVEDGEVKILNLEEGPGVCEATAGETLLAAI